MINWQNKNHRFISDTCNPQTLLLTVFKLFIGFHPIDENLSHRLLQCLKYIFFRQQDDNRTTKQWLLIILFDENSYLHKCIPMQWITDSTRRWKVVELRDVLWPKYIGFHQTREVTATTLRIAEVDIDERMNSDENQNGLKLTMINDENIVNAVGNALIPLFSFFLNILRVWLIS